MTKPYFDVQDISYTYQSKNGEVEALKDLSFQIYQGEFLAIVGPSGCGKSTLLSILSRLLIPQKGTITINDPDGGLQYPRIGYMLQSDCLLEWRSIYKNILLGLEIQGKCTPEKIEYANQLLKEYGLFEFRNNHPSELSGGMKQRAALIRTLVLEPQLLLLDEPFSALDYMNRLMVSTDISQIIRQKRQTALLITHDLSEAISLADRVLVLTKRPATVIANLPIHLTLTEHTAYAARNAPEYSTYFNQLWEVLSHETNNIT